MAAGGSTHAPVVVGTPAPPLYHRIESPSQDRGVAAQQVTSMEVWGAPAQGSSIPSVKAYRHGLTAARGIEFCSNVAPTRGRGAPFEARWYLGDPGVLDRRSSTYAAIPIAYIEHTGAVMYRQIPLDTVAGRDFVAQAILGVPPRELAEQRSLSFVEGHDDLDWFEGAAVTVEDKIPVVLKHHRGYPANTTTLYLPAEITNVAEITYLIAFVMEKMWIPPEWLTWQRANDPDL